MTSRAERNAKAFSLVIVCSMVLGGLFAIAGLLIPIAQAGVCDQVGGVITGDWTISSTQVCTGIVYTVDGTININAGGSLTLVNGGIRFSKDLAHRSYALNVNSGGALILDNSYVTTVTEAIDPYLFLPLTVTGSFAMRNGAMLKFPGWFNSTSGATLNFTNSRITGFTDAELTGLFTSGVDENNDGPRISWFGTTASIYRSRIERIYEGISGGANLDLFSSSVAYIYDTYIEVDPSNNAGLHNELRVDGTSSAHLYNVTIDITEAPPAKEDWVPAFRPTAAGGNIYILRWLHATAADSYGYPIANATVWSRLSPAATTAQYPDNGFASTPSSRTLWYLGRTPSGATQWNLTDVNGRAKIPLYTDRVDTASLPNAESFGNYAEVALYNGTTASAGAFFPSYPTIEDADNNLELTISFTSIRLAPDLTIVEIQVSGGNGPFDSQPINTDITLTAVVRNDGNNSVRNVMVSFFSDDVDKNLDGLMDFDAASFRASAGIGDVVIPVVPRIGTATASVTWRPIGIVESSRTVSAVVDPPIGLTTDPGTTRETTELNNIRARAVTLFTWPDLSVSSTDVTFETAAVVNNDVYTRVTIRNEGTNRALGATAQVFEAGTPLSNVVSYDILNGNTVSVTLVWQPTAVRLYNLEVRVAARGDTFRNQDYRPSNNAATVPKTVLSPPDLEVLSSDYPATITVNQGQGFSILVRVYNRGLTPAQNVSVAIYLDSTRTVELGRVAGISVSNFTDVTVPISGINIAGTRSLYIIADPENRLNEGGPALESNNFANATVNVLPPQGTVVISTPANGTKTQPGVQFIVSGAVRDRNFVGIQGVTLYARLERPDGTILDNVSVVSGVNGVFSATFPITEGYADGDYRVVVAGPGGFITTGYASFTVQRQLPFYLQPMPFLPFIPWWLFLAALGAVIGLVVGASMYHKYYGIGKMVECGECGAFIAEGSMRCPKCGVEFERDMAKCSNCQSWIPVEVKRCPECGVEFATGQVEMADYQDKMRLQYDEVVAKFKEEAQRQLGRSLSDREFQEWWRKQATFVTFEDWLREEEEMRKMGSKPCSVCGSLNSVTATVCHKCGSLMKESRPPGGGGGGGAPPGASAGEQPGAEAAPRRIIRRPVANAPVVQKKVIRRPVSEGGTESEGKENQEDDL